MKKVMLFLAMFLISLSASAATLTLQGNPLNALSFGATGTDQGESVSLGGFPLGQFSHFYDFTSDEDTTVDIKLSAFPSTTPMFFNITADGFNDPVINVPVVSDLVGSYAFYTLSLKANEVFNFIIGGTSEVAYTIEATVSAVPVPAAALLFAPALVGFVALRRKAVKAA